MGPISLAQIIGVKMIMYIIAKINAEFVFEGASSPK